SGLRYAAAQRSGDRIPGTRFPAQPRARRPAAIGQSPAPDERQRAHGVLEQVDEVGHVPPPLLRQRPRASRSDPQLRPLLQPPAPAFFAGVYPADHVRTAMRLTVRCPPFRRKSPPRPGRIVDESQAEAIANAMLEPGRRAQEELRRKRLAEAANLAK